MPIVKDKVYEKFINETGLQVSRATFYRMRRELLSGNDNRLTRILENADKETVPRHLRPSFKKNANPDEVPFLGFDGEGITLEGKHSYVLMANSDGESLYRPNGISTSDALRWLLRSKKRRTIRVWFSFGYDIQQILKDVPDRDIVRLMHGGIIRYEGYRLSYMPGKIFSINNVRFYDVFNYWQTSFIRAVTETLGKEAVSEELKKGKESRSDFADWRLEDILSYTHEELTLLVELCNHLRDILLRADIHLGSSFYGPGAIANYWFKSHGIAPPKIDDPTLVDVMERAYYGGRFETFTLGKIDGVYECDINSAYPAIITDLPYLDNWEWYPPHNFDRSPYGVWKVEWHLPNNSKIGPFPSRDKRGLISYPANGIGWYWRPEIDAALRIYGSQHIRILGGYIPKTVEGRPFEWVQAVYNRRLELKANNDPAQQGLKIGLNSIYGKTAQRVGSQKYFSLAWAGYITAATRAKLLNLAEGRENSVIAFATDAVYFDRDPKIVASNRLGEFGSKRWDTGYFIQSGVYRLVNGPVSKDAYRGFSVKNGIQDIFDQIRENYFRHPYVYQLKFVGLLESIRCPNTLGRYRLSFITVRKKLQPFRTTKRRVTDPEVWVIADTSWLDEEMLIGARSKDYVRPKGVDGKRVKDTIVWNYYAPLLKRKIETEILEHHNDHSDLVFIDKGELEESYPFRRLADRQEEMALTETDDIAEERIGGASGLIDVKAIGNRPIVDQDAILGELATNGNKSR